MSINISIGSMESLKMRDLLGVRQTYLFVAYDSQENKLTTSLSYIMSPETYLKLLGITMRTLAPILTLTDKHIHCYPQCCVNSVGRNKKKHSRQMKNNYCGG